MPQAFCRDDNIISIDVMAGCSDQSGDYLPDTACYVHFDIFLSEDMESPDTVLVLIVRFYLFLCF